MGCISILVEKIVLKKNTSNNIIVIFETVLTLNELSSRNNGRF